MKDQHISTTDERSLAATLPTIVIQSSRGWAPARLGDIVLFRELLYFLVWRQLKVRYKQTLLGAAWAVIQPLAIMVIFTIVFERVIRVETPGIPYPIFVFSGVVVWTYFSNALNQSSNSLVSYESLITKVYFPRLLAPVASVLAGLVDFAIALVVLVGMIGFYVLATDVSAFTAGVWALPLFLLLAVMTALAASLWLSALNVQYRDVRLLMSVLIQLWFFATPIIYPSSLIPESWQPFYHALNPMAGVVEGFRWALLGEAPAPSPMLAVAVSLVVVALVGGLYYFRRMEKTFADMV